LECQVRACLNRSCQPKCASDRRLSAHTDTTVYENLNEYDEYLLSEAIQEYENEFEISEEIIYQDEPETDRNEPEVRELAAELADMTHVRAAMLKSANRFKTIEDDNPHNEHQITRYDSLGCTKRKAAKRPFYRAATRPYQEDWLFKITGKFQY